MSVTRAATSDFKYLPLAKNQIRLLEIKNGFEYDEVRCRLHEISIDQVPRFAAISYRWGTTADRMSIRIGSQTIEVMPNAYWAVHYLRKRGQWRYIWIDCICIDQSDVWERNCQVARMGQIYSRASEVIIWLGLPNESIKAAFDKLRRAFGDAQTTDDLRALLRSLDPICSVDYWLRIWIVQEILFASNLTLLCGVEQLHWECLAYTMAPFRGSLDLTAPQAAIINLLLQRRALQCQGSDTTEKSFKQLRREFGISSSWGLENLLQRFSQAECSDPRDKVYALLEIWNTQASKPFAADYRRSVRDVFWTTYAYIVQHSVAPSYPAFCRTLQETLGYSDSNADPDNPLCFQGDVKRGNITLTLSTSENIDIPTLRILCRQVSTITEVCQVALKDNFMTGLVAWAAQFSTRCLPHLYPHSSVEYYIVHLVTLVEQIWRADSVSPYLYIDDQGYIGLAAPRPRAGDHICGLPSGDLLVERHRDVVGMAYLFPQTPQLLWNGVADVLALSSFQTHNHEAFLYPQGVLTLSTMFEAFPSYDDHEFLEMITDESNDVVFPGMIWDDSSEP